MNRSTRIAVGLVSYLSGQALIVAGIVVLIGDVSDDLGIEIALILMASGTILLMRRVIDVLVPDASKWFTGSLKLVVAATFFVASSLMLLNALTSRHDLLPPA